ncbi:UNVERIFIED_CONTAM: ADP-ribosylation factor-like protein 15 [Gekko kuhli]
MPELYSETVLTLEWLLKFYMWCFRALCCKGPPPPRPEYDLVCIGLTGSGKTSLLSQLCSENRENIVSTTGFSIKAVPFQNAILNVKELGGHIIKVTCPPTMKDRFQLIYVNTLSCQLK